MGDWLIGTGLIFACMFLLPLSYEGKNYKERFKKNLKFNLWVTVFVLPPFYFILYVLNLSEGPGWAITLVLVTGFLSAVIYGYLNAEKIQE